MADYSPGSPGYNLIHLSQADRIKTSIDRSTDIGIGNLLNNTVSYSNSPLDMFGNAFSQISGTSGFSTGHANIRDYTIATNVENPTMKYFNSQLFEFFNPDLNGFVLCFMVPPPLSGIKGENTPFVENFRKLIAFAAIDFTTPQFQVSTENIALRVGAIPYVTEVNPSEQCTVTFIDNANLDIYNYHQLWVQYMKEVVEGRISPDSDYFEESAELNGLYRALDYVGAVYFVKYTPSFSDVQYVGKATGIFPQNLPSKELLGQRGSNELTTLPFTYFSAYYEETSNKSHIICRELDGLIKEYYGENIGQK